MNDENRRERIEAAMQRYESRDKAKPRHKRKAVKLFSIDRYEPERERAINAEDREPSGRA